MVVVGLGLAVAVGSSLPSGFAGRSPFFRSSLRPNPLRHVGSSLFHRRLPRLPPISALDSDIPRPIHRGSEKLKNSKSFEQWDSLTARFSAGANVPFLLLQLPQIILNARNLMAGNKSALLAVPWLGMLTGLLGNLSLLSYFAKKRDARIFGMLTGLLGNLSLLSYFAKKREAEAVVVQTLGAVSTYVVIVQLAMGEAMPLPHFIVTSIVVASGLVLNFLFYFGLLNTSLWHLWEDFITIGGVSALPQVIWSTLVPFIPNSILPGAIFFLVGLVAVVMARTGKLPEKGVKFVKAISGWTATLLFMWMPVAQMMTNLLRPENIKGLSAFTMLLAMIGNGLLIPRALFIRDFMWFLGSSWASIFYGWGNLICLYYFNIISREFFLATTVALYAWIGIAFWRDAKVYEYDSPISSMKALVSGS